MKLSDKAMARTRTMEDQVPSSALGELPLAWGVRDLVLVGPGPGGIVCAKVGGKEGEKAGKYLAHASARQISEATPTSLSGLTRPSLSRFKACILAGGAWSAPLVRVQTLVREASLTPSEVCKTAVGAANAGFFARTLSRGVVQASKRAECNATSATATTEGRATW